MGSKLIYVVDDEQNIRDLVKAYLVKEGFDVEIFPDGASACGRFSAKPADMLVIDIMMPGMDGYSLCREIRKTSDVPIIMVSAKDDEIDRILGLEMGSDDYISKPFSPRELVTRVKTVFRRVKDGAPVSGNPAQSCEKCRDTVIYPDERRVICRDAEIDLTAKEFDLIYHLVKNRNRVFTREQLIETIWGYDYAGETRSVDDLVKRIRRKLADAGSVVEIVTVWGYGYKVSDQDSRG